MGSYALRRTDYPHVFYLLDHNEIVSTTWSDYCGNLWDQKYTYSVSAPMSIFSLRLELHCTSDLPCVMSQTTVHVDCHHMMCPGRLITICLHEGTIDK